jgi:pimeloyl-ACP methyl ester carboxylesterase
MKRRALERFYCVLYLTLDGEKEITLKRDTWSDPSPHESGFVTVNGVRLNYLDWGGSGEPLVLIHGAGANPHCYDDLAPAFTDSFRVVAYARRGHDQSDMKEPYDTATLTEDLHGFMDALGIVKAHLAGWSLGGNEITAMAAKHPKRVGSLVYLDAGYDWADPAFVEAFKYYPESMTTPASALASLDAFREYQRITWAREIDPSKIEAYIRDLVVIQSDGTVKERMNERTAQELYASILADRRDYTNVHSPALAIYARTMLDLQCEDSTQRKKNLAWERKFMAPFRKSQIERIRRELPGVKIVNVPGTHNNFLFTCRQQVLEAMRGFLGSSVTRR